MLPSRQKMIAGMLASDASCDGRFLVGVLSTGIYCLPSCRARKPKLENVRFFDRPEAAEEAGLRPCKRCRPLLFYRDQDPDRRRVEELTERLRHDPATWRNVREMVAASGVGSSKLSELFRRHYHTTPLELLARERVRHARQRLLAGTQPVSEVAFAAGFESLSAFNEHFRRSTGMSPQSYRRLLGVDRFEIALPPWFGCERVLAYLGRDPASASERVNGRRVRLGLWTAGVPAAVEVELQPRRASCTVEAAGELPATAAAEAHGQLLRLLGLTLDPRAFERRLGRQGELARLIAGRRGLSIPQTAAIFDGLVWVIAGQQVSLAVAFGMRRRLTERLGEPVPGGVRALPLAERVAELTHEELRGLGYSRSKAEYLQEVARQVATGALDLGDLAQRSAGRVERALGAVRGLGPWSVQYLLMRSFGLVDCVPAGDVALRRNLARFFALAERPGEAETHRLMQPFAPYRSLATFHLWSLEEEAQ